MQCPRCQAENREGRQFCAECGVRLVLSCPSCGFSNEPGEKFCGGCGTLLAAVFKISEPKFRSPHSYTPQHLADKILQSKTAIEGEQKQVTVLFADITNSTDLARLLGPEAMYTLLNQFFELALAHIHRYEGTINQFLGDGFMALFGAPIAHEDHARRAILAALDVQEALNNVRQATTRSLQIRMGVNTGMVVVGAIGDNLRMDYTAVGDTTNLAARLQQTAEPGSIVISAATHRLIAGYFDTRPLGERWLKGRVEPVNAWKVISARMSRTRLEVEAERGLTPFVGRERELGLMQACFDKTKVGQGQQVFIVGEPGIGKSRLLLEFRRRLGTEAAWQEGHSMSFGTSIAFYPLIDWLKRNLRIEEGDAEEKMKEKIKQRVLRLGEDLSPTIPYLRYLLAVDPGDPAIKSMDPKQRRGEIFDALRRTILKAAQAHPQVLVFEDLHWMDQATEAFLRFFSDSIPASRVLCIFTYRPGYANPFGERTYHTRISLASLSSTHSVQMARAMLASDRLPAELQSLIVKKAEGNPFYVEEVVKSLQEVGAIRRKANRYRLVKSIDEVIIPDTIQDVIMARIDRLEEAPKKTLQLAAVIGREFTPRLLDRFAEIHGRTESYLEQLKTLELIYQKHHFPELIYMFKHALTQEVAYHSLLVQKRRELHRLIAQTIEESYADRLAEHYEILAYHFSKGEEWPKALNYILRAAKKASLSFANREAVALYDQALKIAEHLDNSLDHQTQMNIHQSKSDLYFVLSDFKRSQEEGEQALALARQVGDRILEGRVLTSLGYARFWSHDFNRSLDYARQVITVAKETGVDSIKAGGHFITGTVHAITGNLNQGGKEIDQALSISQSVGDILHQSFSLGLKGHLNNWKGEYTEGIRYLTEGLRIAQEHHLLAPYFDNLFMYGITLTGKGDYDQAFTTLQDGLAFSEKVGDEVYHLRMMNTLGWLYLECGDLEQAAYFNRRAAEGARTRGDPEGIANAELNLGDIYLAKNDLVSAWELFDGIHRLVHDPATSEWMKWRYSMHLFSSFGEFWLARGDPTKALEFAERCLVIAARTDSRKYLVKGWRLKGEIALNRRQLDEAGAALQTALSMARTIANPTQLWKTYLAMGQYHTEAGHQRQARQSYQAACNVIDQVKESLQNPELRSGLESSSLIQRVYGVVT